MKSKQREKSDLIAQWAFDTRPILGRFHLWLEDVEVEWVRGDRPDQAHRTLSFMDGPMERLSTMTAAVTALGTQLFGRFGEGAGMDKQEINRVKKDADAISAYVMSESLWYATRLLPENHAIMVCLGEGLMPKAGESPEMGSNPQLGFGRVYARPQVAQWLDARVSRLLNDADYGWHAFYAEIKEAGLTIWGAAIDTLENTSRFAKGEPTGPMTVLHLFNQPLNISQPYEGYIGNLLLPREVVDTAAEQAVLIDYHTPRAKVLEAIEATWPGIRREHIHVWTLRGQSRVTRLQGLWDQWQELGVHLVEDGWLPPSGIPAFTDSGTYAPTFLIGTWQDADGATHLFFCDGYAASAEAMQAASLAPSLGLEASLAVFSSKFKLSYDKERHVMRLDPNAESFAGRMAELFGEPLEPERLESYKHMIQEARGANLDLDKRCIRADEFFPEKRWRVLALCGYMQPDPYTGAPGVQRLDDNRYRVSTHLATAQGAKNVHFTLRFMEGLAESRLIFNPLINRFLSGEDFRERAVKISDSGRLRNELQTLCSEALEHVGARVIRVIFDRIPDEVVPEAQQKVLLEVLLWYKRNHPIWFDWLEVVAPSA